MHVPYPSLKTTWHDGGKSFDIILPWLDMTIDVDQKDAHWVREATTLLYQKTSSPSVQKFFDTLKDYPLSYQAPRREEDFKGKNLQLSPQTGGKIDFSTPEAFVHSLSAPLGDDLKHTLPSQWTWDLETILSATKMPESHLYDPVSVVTYLICYRLQWESTTWSGQDGLGRSLEALLEQDEEKFFWVMGWISRQSHYITTQFHISVQPALKHFPAAKKEIQHFIQDEVGHHKFMEQTLHDLGFKGPEEFSLGQATRWILDAFEEMGRLSPLAFSAMINLFEAAYYEGQDPLSRVLKKSSKPEAARGYDLHYKINQEHRHCDMPVIFSKKIAPQTKDHVCLTVRLFECALHLLDEMEKQVFEKNIT